MRKLNKHFSHPHALELSEPSKHEEDNNNNEVTSITCSACDQQIIPSDEPTYACPKRDSCEFALHKSCFELPETLDHKSHPDHKLTLLPEPPQYSLYYHCNACGALINGFSFHCEACDFKIHPKCAFLPESVECRAHEVHALVVRYCTPKSTKEGDYGILSCGVCDGGVTEGYWSYFCEECDFCADLECAFVAEVAEAERDEEDEDEDEEGLSDAMRLHRANIKAMDQMARLQFQTKMAEMNARTVSMLFRTTI